MKEISKLGWTHYKLDELGSIGRGKSKHRPRNHPSLFGGKYPFIQTGKVKASELYISSYSQTYNEKGLSQSKLWKPDTLLITIAANIAETAILKIAACFPDSIVGFIADPLKADVKFIKYYIDTIKIQMQNVSKGTTQDNLSLDKLLRFDILTPPIHTQNKIVGILSAYDDLIENNIRRIKILESMAQTLYQEWFVQFRFPGHEVKMVESELGLIPEGWEFQKLAKIADINKKNINKNNAPKQINYINITSVSPGRINEIETINFDNAPSRARRLVNHGDIIWFTVRPNRKSYSLIMNPIENSVASTGFAVISAKKTAYSYLYHALTTDDFVHYLTNNATGSAYPAVNTNDFKNADIVLPEKNIVERFNSIVEDMLFEKENLQQKNINLRKTRDLLLPKLISGQIDVENLDIDTGELAA